MKELSMHILDIAENSIRAKAKEIKIIVNEDIEANQFSFEIIDDGKGIDEAMLKHLADPFTTSRTMRKVGMGIPLLTQNSRLCEGDVTIESTVGVGTKLVSYMKYDHIDRPPLGDIASTVTNLMSSNSDVNIYYQHIYKGEAFDISTKELLDELEGVPLTDLQVMTWLKNFIKENINALKECP